jgi:NodT family efflux transporter outer membrane factor (OMF) lipoprotein
MRRLIVLTLALLTSACASSGGPVVQASALAAAATGPFQAAPADTTGAEPVADWWRLYRDPVLEGLVEKALAANTDLRAANANLLRAQAALRGAHGERLPMTAVSSQARYGDADPQGLGREDWARSAGFSMNWEVDLFGRISSTIAASKADADAVAAVRDQVRATVAAETARAYADACAFADAAAAARSALTVAQDSLKLVIAQEQAGAASRLEVEQAATAVANAQAAVSPIEAQRKASLFGLAALIGVSPAEVPAEAAACVRPPRTQAALPVGDGAGLLRRRPDVREAERRLAAAAARIGVATADLYPRISLGAGIEDAGGELSSTKGTTFSLGPVVSWSFPNVVAARARLAQARAQNQASLAQFDGAVLGALKDVERSLAFYDAESDRNQALTQASARAEAAYQLADHRYRAGEISFLQLLTAQRDLVAARTDLALSAQRLGSVRIDVFKALGA